MPVQFGRQVEVLAGSQGQEAAIGISDLRIGFNIKKTGKKTTNTCNVDIYNLSKETFNTIAVNCLENFLILKAGYKESKDLDKILFHGDIVDFRREIRGADIVSTFECSDGNKAINFARNTVSYKAGTSAKKILSDLIKSFPLANLTAVVIPNLDDIEFGNGFAASGKIADMISNITALLGLEWSIQNNELKIIKIDGNDGTRAVHLTPKTGLISSPVRINDVSIDGQKQKGLAGWKIKCLLQPLIEPNGIISIESAEIGANSFFKVIAVDHSGDTHSGAWTTEAEVIDNVA